MSSLLSLPVPADFHLDSAVCSYGFYLLAPNRWDSAARTLHRPLRRADGTVVDAKISQAGKKLRIRTSKKAGSADRELLKASVRRMLRVDEDQSAWYRRFPAARRRRFGRLFRSPTLFEDLLKTITSCNISWSGTLRMNERLCAEAGRGGDFPTAAELAAWKPRDLARRCGVGYRADSLVRLARQVAEGSLDLSGWERAEADTGGLFEQMLKLPGVGPYAASNLLQVLGRFDRIPIDTEARRHAREYHGRTGSPGNIDRWVERHYRRYGEWAFKVYWFEHWTAHSSGQA